MDKPEQETSTVADDLLVGAENIAKFLYDDVTRVRDVYRNVAGLTFFKHGAALAAFKSTLREELREAERKARENRQLKASMASRVVERRRKPRKSDKQGSRADRPL